MIKAETTIVLKLRWNGGEIIFRVYQQVASRSLKPFRRSAREKEKGTLSTTFKLVWYYRWSRDIEEKESTMERSQDPMILKSSLTADADGVISSRSRMQPRTYFGRCIAWNGSQRYLCNSQQIDHTLTPWSNYHTSTQVSTQLSI